MNMKELAFTEDLSLAARGMYLVLRKSHYGGVGSTFKVSHCDGMLGLSRISSEDVCNALCELTDAKILTALGNDGSEPSDKYDTIYRINR